MSANCACQESVPRKIEQSGWTAKIAAAFEPKEQYLIPILQFIQSEAGYLPPEAMHAAARYLRISPARLYGVASFYAQFYFQPRGRHKITICCGTACHVRGAARLVDEMESRLKVKTGGTTEDMNFTLETVACVGACALAPVVLLDGRVLRQQTVASLTKAVGELVKGQPGSPSAEQPPETAERAVQP